MGEKVITSKVIQSQLYGELQPEVHQVYHFEQGIIGFSHLNQFALLPYEDTALFILQSFDDEISLLLLPAELSANSSGFNIGTDTIEQLGVHESNEIVTFYIVRFIDNTPYINLKAPILIVPQKQKGCQYVIPNESVSIRESLLLVGDAHVGS